MNCKSMDWYIKNVDLEKGWEADKVPECKSLYACGMASPLPARLIWSKCSAVLKTSEPSPTAEAVDRPSKAKAFASAALAPMDSMRLSASAPDCAATNGGTHLTT